MWAMLPADDPFSLTGFSSARMAAKATRLAIRPQQSRCFMSGSPWGRRLTFAATGLPGAPGYRQAPTFPVTTGGGALVDADEDWRPARWNPPLSRTQVRDVPAQAWPDGRPHA